MDTKHTKEFHDALRTSPEWVTLPAIAPMVVPAWEGDDEEPAAPGYTLELRNCVGCGSTLAKVVS